jgi:hypothetical protein
MLLAIIVSMFNCKWRGMVLSELRGKTGVYAIAAVVSMIISGVSGIVGRTGWFADIFALIAMARFIINNTKPENGKMCMLASMVIALLLLAQQSIIAVWQVKLGREADMVEAKFKQSENGVVFQNVTYDDEITPIALWRLRGVPDADDFYLLKVYAEYWGKPEFILVPEDAEYAIQHNLVKDYIMLHNGHILSVTKPNYINDEIAAIVDYEVHVSWRGGRQWVVQDFEMNGEKYYYHSPRIWDPGDR